MIAELEKLPIEVRGQRVDTLVAWVETALTVSFSDISAHSESLSIAVEALSEGIAKLVEAASAIAHLIPPEDTAAYQEWSREQPWRREFDPIASALYGLGLGRTEEGLNEAEEAVTSAVRLLSRLPSTRDMSSEGVLDCASSDLCRAVTKQATGASAMC